MLWINAPHFCAGIEPRLRAAPILRWMITERLIEQQIRRICAKKGWEVETVPDRSYLHLFEKMSEDQK